MKKMTRTALAVMAVLAMAFAICITGISPTRTEAAADKMTRADFVKAVVQQVTGKKNVNGKKITVKLNSNGSVKVYGKTVKAKTVNTYKKNNGVTKKQAQYIAAAVQLGLVDKNMKNAKKNITYADAMVILAKADRLMYKDTFTEADVTLVKNKRLTGLLKVAESKQDDIAKAWMLGYYAGKSDGNFTRTRTINYTKAAKKSDLTAMVKRLTVKKERYQLSDDFQMLRISKKNRPKQEKYFAYILDDFTNEYYDMEFEFMQKTSGAYVGVNLGEEFENVESDIKLYTWDNAFKKMPYAKRATWIVDYHNRVANGGLAATSQASDSFKFHCQYIFPSELEKFLKYFDKYDEGFGYSYASTVMKKDEMALIAEKAEEYTRTVFSVDYRTLSDLATSSCPVRFSDEYIRDAVLNETIIECDCVAADPSSIYYQVNYDNNRMQGYIIRVYVHYRIVSDNGKGGNSIVYNNIDNLSTSLREVKVSKDGLSYEWAGNDGEWRDGYFELEFSDGAYSYIRSDFDLTRARNHYTKLLGGPNQCAYREVGDLTKEGLFQHEYGVEKNDTKEQIAKWRKYYESDYGDYVPMSY